MVVIQDVTSGPLKSAYVDDCAGPVIFEYAKEELEKEGYEIINCEENAFLRIQEGKDAFISQRGNMTKEGFLYFVNSVFLVRNSPALYTPEETYWPERNTRRGFGFNRENKSSAVLVERALEESIEIPYNKLKIYHDDWGVSERYCSKSIPTNKFIEDEVASFVFGSQAEKYGYFLEELGVRKIFLVLFRKEFITNLRNDTESIFVSSKQLFLQGLEGLSFDVGREHASKVCGVASFCRSLYRGVRYD